jgi:AcrR family transcriptional regulator
VDRERLRPLRADARRNRDRLLTVAAASFALSGAGASLEGIAREAGVGIGTLYRHFPTRESLVLAAYWHEVERLCHTADELLATLPPDRALREWMDQLTRYAITKRGMAEALTAATSSEGAALPHAYNQVIGALARLLDAGVGAGTIRADVSAEDMILALAGLWRLKESDEGQAQARRLIDLLMDGLRAVPSSPRP